VFLVFRSPPQATKLPALRSLPVLTAMDPALPRLRHAARRIAERGRVAGRLHRQHGRLLSIVFIAVEDPK